MKCPRCKGKQNCSCNSCVNRRSHKVTTWKWDESGNIISCGYCNLTMHADAWQDEEYRQYYLPPSPDSKEGK